MFADQLFKLLPERRIHPSMFERERARNDFAARVVFSFLDAEPSFLLLDTRLNLAFLLL
jgi:hypothetical protein